MPEALPYRHIGRARSAALRSLAALSEGDTRPKTLHTARTEMRRLQAFLDLIGEAGRAQQIAACVSKLSGLRTLQVFGKYLASIDASKADRRRASRRAEKAFRKLQRDHIFRSIHTQVHQQTTSLPVQSDQWMAARFHLLRDDQADVLLNQLAVARRTPRRKVLHALRLLIKAVRYQEELALLYRFGNPDVVRRLQDAQGTLGEYEERAEFRKLGKELGLRCRKRLKKDWRRARRRARRVPQALADLPHALIDSRVLHLQPAGRAPRRLPRSAAQGG